MALNERKRIDFKVSLTAIRLMDALAKNLGVGRTHIIELAIRQMAESKGVK
jgi:hypothetical protein